MVCLTVNVCGACVHGPERGRRVEYRKCRSYNRLWCLSHRLVGANRVRGQGSKGSERHERSEELARFPSPAKLDGCSESRGLRYKGALLSSSQLNVVQTKHLGYAAYGNQASVFPTATISRNHPFTDLSLETHLWYRNANEEIKTGRTKCPNKRANIVYTGARKACLNQWMNDSMTLWALS
jgi:hypothetical protein